MQFFFNHILRSFFWILMNFKPDIFTNIYINMVFNLLAFKEFLGT